MSLKNYSVLMSVYHKEKPEFLKCSIESMINQSLKPDEIVIVKDGKLTDELDEVIEIYKKKYPKLFTIISLEKNIGLGLALNEGLKICRNELVARMDTDDISLENRCELQVNEFKKNPQLTIVGCIINEFYDTPNNIVSSRVVPETHEEILEFSRKRSPFNHPTVMYKKTDVLECGGYRDINRKEDIDLFVRMLNRGYKSMNINKPLLLYRSNEDNFQRRKNWTNCKNSIQVTYGFWRKGYCSITDFLTVAMAQFIVFVSPVWVFKLLSKLVLRKGESK